MSTILVGLNHRSAPVEIREKLSLAGCGLTMALEDLNVQPIVEGAGACPSTLQEGAILSTCNRLEVYAIVDDAAAGWAAIEDYLATMQGLSSEALHPHLYFMKGLDAITHLMRVAAGLDSQVLGEPQILGQVTQAFSDAQTVGTTGPMLSHLFARAIHAGKRARTETDISRHTTSVSHAGVLLAKEKLGDLATLNILLIGAGEMGEITARALKMHGAGPITCMNRTYARAEALVQEVGGAALNWYHLPDALAWADLVVTATGAPHTIVHLSDVEDILPQREGRPLMFVDIAVPRDVEEPVGELPGVTRYDIDDLQSALDDNLDQRRAAIPQVEGIVKQEALTYLEWMHSRQVAPVISDLRSQARALAEAELERAFNRLDDLTPREQKVIRTMVNRIVNKLLHEPTTRLREHATNGDGYTYAHTIRELFALDDAYPHDGHHNGHGPSNGDGEPVSAAEGTTARE